MNGRNREKKRIYLLIHNAPEVDSTDLPHVLPCTELILYARSFRDSGHISHSKDESVEDSRKEIIRSWILHGLSGRARGIIREDCRR